MQFEFTSTPVDESTEGEISCHVVLDFLKKRDGLSYVELNFPGLEQVVEVAGATNVAGFIEALIRLGKELDQFWRPSGSPQPALVKVRNTR